MTIKRNMKQANFFKVQKGWKSLMLDIGINPAHVLVLAKIPEDLFSRPEAQLTPAEYYRLWQALDKLVEYEEPALLIRQALRVETFDPAIFASLCSPDLNVALQRLAEYKRLICPMHIDLHISSKETKVMIRCYGYDEPIPFSVSAMEVVFKTELARIGTRQRIIPTRVELPVLPTNLAPYKKYFGGPVVQGETVSITFSGQDANRPFVTENKAMWDFFEPELKRRLSELDRETSTGQRVKSALLEMLPSGESTIERVCKRLAVSKRSLQRHLKSEELNFKDVLKNTRKELAEHYLKKSDLPQAEISFLLGFQDSNSFLRAFKNWTGQTPGDFRNSVLA